MTEAMGEPSANMVAALAHISAGRLAEAETICRAVCEGHPDHGQAWHLLGAIALQTGNAAAAIDYCRRAIAAAPTLTKAHSNLGGALLANGQVGEAILALEAAIKIDPDFALAYVNLGNALTKADRLDQAVAALEHAVALQPNHALAYNNLGAALTRQKRLDEAVVALTTAIDLDPRQAQAHNNLGIALLRKGNFTGALAALHRAQELDPATPEITAYLGIVYRAMGRLDEAVAWFGKALELRPDYVDSAYLRSAVLLVQGRFADGWRDYLERPLVRHMTLPLHRQPLDSDLTGVRVLLVKDQGLGDEIFFLRFAPELKRRGAHLTYWASGKIATMLRRLAFLDSVIDETSLVPASDMTISVGDLPFLLGMKSVDDIPPSLDFSVLPACLAAQQAALAALGPPPYIGVTWRAGSDQMETLQKAISLDRLGAVLRRLDGTLVALQRAPQIGEIDALSATLGAPVHDLSALNDSLEDMLALLSLLDDYVTVSNTNVHLRLAMGRGSLVLVPSPPEFRWMAAGSVSPWYPSCKVYRQEIGGSWDTALATLASDLSASVTAQRGDKH